VLDRVLLLKLNLPRLSAKGAKWDDPLTADCLRRVRSLDCYYRAVKVAALNSLRKCRHLTNATVISFENAETVPLGAIEKLYLSPALPNITVIHLDGEEWFADDHSTLAEDEHLAAFITRIGASEKAAQLTYLQLNWLIGPKVAQALLDSPHLRPSNQLCLFMHRGLNKATRTALKKRFGKALRM
jgi:hypothetical protein